MGKVEEKETVNCLKNERVIVRFVPKRGRITNPKHILYGGMADNATRMFTVPMLASGRYVNVLTDSEKDFLEEIMGLEKNALSVYRKTNNFWDESTNGSIVRVILKKQDNFLDLSSPGDYIKYKILLANKDFIAPSLDVLENQPKATYQFVCIKEGDEVKASKNNMSNTMMCYKLYGKIEEDKETLSFIVETIEGRPISSTTKLEFIQAKINELIQANPKKFLSVIQDKMLSTKVLIKKGINAGTISKKGDYLYLRSDNTPLCNDNEEPTLEVAAKYLNNPKNQTIKFAIEADLKNK